jgi:hypothetical protein
MIRSLSKIDIDHYYKIFEKVSLFEFDIPDHECVSNDFLLLITEKTLFGKTLSKIEKKDEWDDNILSLYDFLTFRFDYFDIENSKNQYIQIYNRMRSFDNELYKKIRSCDMLKKYTQF